MKDLQYGFVTIGLAGLIFVFTASATTRYVDLNSTNSTSPFIDSDFVISAENDLAHLGCLSGQFVDQSRTGFRVAESGLG